MRTTINRLAPGFTAQPAFGLRTGYAGPPPRRTAVPTPSGRLGPRTIATTAVRRPDPEARRRGEAPPSYAGPTMSDPSPPKQPDDGAGTARPAFAASHTTTRLLDALADPADEASWVEIDRRYRPIVVGVARRIGLGEEAASEIAQETMVAFLTSFRRGGYDRSRGRLRSWIVGISRHRIADYFADAKKRHRVGGDTMISELSMDTDFDDLWQTERRRVILRRALEELPERSRLKSSTIEAFTRFAIDRQPVTQVADELGLTVDDVYQAKNRVAAKLRTIAADLERRFDEEATP